jgi:two-component sensor histidine kinase
MRFAYALNGRVEELQALRSNLESWAQSLPELADELVIVANELAANAITHGQAPAQVVVIRVGQSMRISVQQLLRSPSTFPQMSRLAHGRQGLRLVNQLCESWGWGSSASTLVAWAELR